MNDEMSMNMTEPPESGTVDFYFRAADDVELSDVVIGALETLGRELGMDDTGGFAMRLGVSCPEVSVVGCAMLVVCRGLCLGDVGVPPPPPPEFR